MIGGIQRKMVDLMVDSGADCTVCGPNDFPDFPVVRDGPEVKLHAADGRALKWYGRKSVSFEAHGERLSVEFNVVDVTRPILSVASWKSSRREQKVGRRRSYEKAWAATDSGSLHLARCGRYRGDAALGVCG